MSPFQPFLLLARFRKSRYPLLENSIFFALLLIEVCILYGNGAAFADMENEFLRWLFFTMGFSLNMLASVYFLKILFHYNRIPHVFRELFPTILISFQFFIILTLLLHYGVLPKWMYSAVFLPVSLIYFISYIPTLLILTVNYQLSIYRSLLFITVLILLKFFAVAPFMGIRL